MAIEKFSEVSVLCDHYDEPGPQGLSGGGRCLNGDARWDTIWMAVFDLRNEGWTIGKKVLCPEHVRSRR